MNERKEKRRRIFVTNSKSPKRLPRPLPLVRVDLFGLSLSGSKIGDSVRTFPESITVSLI
jgi:hypothetical protein